VVAGQVAAQASLGDDLGEELVGDVVVQESPPVLGEGGRVEGGLIDAQVEKPFEQQVVVEPFAERPLGGIEYNAINTDAFNSDSGGTDGRPRVEYIASNAPSSSARTVSTTRRIRRIGWSAGIRSSVDTVVNIANCRSGVPRIPPYLFHPSRKREQPTRTFSAPC